MPEVLGSRDREGTEVVRPWLITPEAQSPRYRLSCRLWSQGQAP